MVFENKCRVFNLILLIWNKTIYTKQQDCLIKQLFKISVLIFINNSNLNQRSLSGVIKHK